MKKTIYSILAACSVLSMASCSDFLDKKSSAYDSDGFYQSEAGLDEGVTGVYSIIGYNQNWDVPCPLMQDVYSPYGLQDEENTTISAGGGLTPDQSYVNSYWKGHWAIVQRANSVIDGALTDPAEMSATYRQRLYECIVVRDYAYYNLVMTFGDIPFFAKSPTTDEYKCERTDKKVIVDYIVNELETIAESEVLPWTSPVRGRVDRATVYALISRYCLLAGSLDFGGEGRAYFTKAAEAAKKVMDNRGLAQNFGDLFTHEGQDTKADVRNEIIWELMYTNGAVRKVHRTRYGHTSRSAGGSSVRFPSPLLAACFECKDGKRIDESPLYDPKHPSWNRDPRFRQTFLMHGDTMQYTESGNKLVLEVYKKTTRFYPNPRRPGTWWTTNNIDVSGTSSSFARNGMGLLWNKYNTDLSESFSESTLNIIIFRVAEMYLTYAEAKIELGEMDQSVYDAINAVRSRAGMPNFDPSRQGNQDRMRQIVRRERKVELAMEGLALCDFRRWQIGDILNAAPIYGQPVPEIGYEGLTKEDMPTFTRDARYDLNDVPDYSAVADKYTARDLKRHWEPRFQWWPIPRADLDRNPNLTNPEGY